jgi:flagellar protein FliS
VNQLLTQYQNRQAETIGPGKRILMLFDGMIRFTENALESHRAQNADDRRYYVGRTQAILLSLMGTLDRDLAGEVGENLVRLYDYIFDLLSQADQTGNEAALHQALSTLRELREVWAEADAIARRSETMPAPAAPTPSAFSLVG